MQVRYKIKGVVSGWALLFDEANGDAHEKFAPSFRDVIMKPGGYAAPSAPRYPLNNTECQLPLRWSQNYATADAAFDSIRALRSAFKGLYVHLQVTVGAKVNYFPNATLASTEHDQKGREMLHTLHFETDDITSNDPS